MLPLPVDPLVPKVADSLRAHPNAVVVAPPGAGKTTRIPPAIADALGKNVVLLQPRRVAARAAASRIAEERGWRIGGEVGWQIRFDNRTTAKTRVRVLTEGILTRRMQSDPFLEDIGCVILDEFHERSIHTDIALAMLREVQRTVRDDLRIVVMSATMQPGPVAEFLGGAPVFESQGRLFPVDIYLLDRPDTRPLWEKAAQAAREELSNADSGHILVFLPGIGEIRRTEALLGAVDAEVHILHSSIAAEAQDAAIRPGTRRKLILATNIAETSLTIDGVRTVIDTGMARVLTNDVRLGIDKLELRRISRASANQRTGRAGRTAPGRCIRLWSRAEDGALEESDLPEVHRIDLCGTVLSLYDFGVKHPAGFPWFEPPRPDALARAVQTLSMLGVVDAQHALTPLGRKVAQVPLHPRFARMLLAGEERGLLREAATLAALLSERDILPDAPAARRRDASHHGDSDALDRYEMFLQRRASLDPAAVRAVEKLRDDLMEAVRRVRA